MTVGPAPGWAGGQPTLRKGQLVLRPWLPADAEQVYRACQDPLIQRFTRVPVPYGREAAVDFVSSAPRDFREHTAAHFAVVAAETDALLGSVGLMAVDLSSASAHIGYWVVPEARGQGVASAAVTALIPWALAPDLGGLTRLVADVDPQNAASIAVLRRAGFVALAGSDAPPCRPGGQPGLTFGLAVPPRPPAT